MKDRNRYSQHSFLFWLIIPALAAWFSFNYVKSVLLYKGTVSADYDLALFSEVATFTQRKYQPLPQSDKGYITLWFDDAWLSQYLKGAVILDEFGFLGTLAVPTEAIEKDNYMNWAQVKTLQEKGWEITNHSRTHDCSMQDWPRDQIRNELKTSTIKLWENKLTSEIFVSPCGVNSEVLQGEVIKQFSAYRTVDPGHNNMAELDRYNLKVRNINKSTSMDEMKEWINQAALEKAWLIFVFHQVAEGSEAEGNEETYNINEEHFRALMQEIKVSGIPVVLPGQVLLRN